MVKHNWEELRPLTKDAEDNDKWRKRTHLTDTSPEGYKTKKEKERVIQQMKIFNQNQNSQLILGNKLAKKYI